MMRSPSATRDETHWWALVKMSSIGRCARSLPITETQRLEFRAELFNALNHPNFSQPDNFIDDDTAGRYPVDRDTDASDSVWIEVSVLKINFGAKRRKDRHGSLGTLVHYWWTKLLGVMKKLRKLSFFFSFVIFCVLRASTQTTVVRPTEIGDVLINPGMGIETFNRFSGRR